MSVSIKVAVRCRPFTIDDKLGVHMVQNGEEEGEVNLLNSTYSTNRFAFTYSWWSAYGFDRHVKSNEDEANAMQLMNQEKVYEQCGCRIKADLLEGSAVVLFAYGLSGSGKTFTVFGPDAPDIPEAWFKHSEPHPLWGIFPRLAFELFEMKKDGWKITMKYFQNVVDTVRDLMSPVGAEQHYKNGMKKDPDGFMDIEWCSSQVLNSWDDLRNSFMSANAKKAIAPTQFNHQSTRGHCIMLLEVEMPHPEMEGMKQRGRVYVCDLAGTEPAGDIVFAKYEKKVYPNGDIEHKYVGAHDDPRKTKELQSQGMKINLSLTEMAQFFMKMAEAVKKKKLKPGASIPGCNSYFLCKYLKDTMLQARTYLFCAIRPEVTYLNYTFSTLGFAKNASVVKLQPKKATVSASPAERKLMAELEEMKAMFMKLQEENDKLKTTGGDEDGSQLEELLAAKQAELANVLGGAEGEEGAASSEDKMMAQQKEEYGRRGIDLTYFEKDTELPHFINLDEDPFRSHRFMYLLQRERTVFGPNGDIKPLALTVVKDHCTVERPEGGDALTLVGGKGTTYLNGKQLSDGQAAQLQPFDRVALGGELLLFVHPTNTPDGAEPPSAEEAVEELQAAIAQADSEGQNMLAQRMKEFEEEKKKWLAQKEKASAEGTEFQDEEPTMDEEKERAWQLVDKEILDLLPKTKEAKSIVNIMDRDSLTFDVALQKPEDTTVGVPKVKVRVENTGVEGSNSILLDPNDFLTGFSVLKDELVHLRTALENDREYTVDEHHDPIQLLFQNTFHLGTAVSFPEFTLYNLPSEDDERHVDIKNCSAPYNNVGQLDVVWTPLAGPEDEDADKEVPDVEDESDLLGKPWTYKISIKSATIQTIMVSSALVQYEFLGQLYTTETIEANTHNPALDYEFIHHVEHVSEELINFLKKPMQLHIWVTPYVNSPKNPVSTTNKAVLQSQRGPSDTAAAGITAAASSSNVAAGEDCVVVQKAVYKALTEEVEQGRAKIAEMEAEMATMKLELDTYRRPKSPRGSSSRPNSPRESCNSPRAKLAAARKWEGSRQGSSVEVDMEDITTSCLGTGES
ncbi:unnamed protein product [Chrysoparadoxa australica]